jgi:gamma-butyrobetaine dioxygenase
MIEPNAPWSLFMSPSPLDVPGPFDVPGLLDVFGDVFASAEAVGYLGEPVSVAAHLLQSGALAAAAGAPDALVAAALLHDVGHVVSGEVVPGEGDEYGNVRHGELGAAWLSRWFPPAVTEPVRLHVAAKRYLCGSDPSYFGQLSQASVHTLSRQGGPMTRGEATAFAALPHAADAVAVRRWDDQAKDPAAAVPGFPHYRPLLARLLQR